MAAAAAVVVASHTLVCHHLRDTTMLNAWEKQCSDVSNRHDGGAACLLKWGILARGTQGAARTPFIVAKNASLCISLARWLAPEVHAWVAAFRPTTTLLEWVEQADSAKATLTELQLPGMEADSEGGLALKALSVRI